MPREYFLRKVETRLSERMGADMVNHIISSQLVSPDMDRETAYRMVMGLIPEIISQVGLDEGLRIGQEIKEIYNSEYL